MVRRKSRYLVVRIKYIDDKIDTKLTPDDIKKAVRDIIKELYGDYGLGAFMDGLYVKYNNPYTGVFFLQVARDYHCEVRTCVSFVKMLRQRLCVLTCIHVTGTLKSAERYLLDYNTRKMKMMYERCKSVTEKQKILGIMREIGVADIIISKE